MPATIKAAAAAARAFAGGAIGVPLLAGGVALEQKSGSKLLSAAPQMTDGFSFQGHPRKDRDGSQAAQGARWRWQVDQGAARPRDALCPQEQLSGTKRDSSGNSTLCGDIMSSPE